MFNQPELDPVDQHIWRKERQMFVTRLSDLCLKNNLSFTTAHHSVNYNKSKIIQTCFSDLLPSDQIWQSRNDECKRRGSTLFVITDNFIEKEDLEFVKFYSDPTLHAFFGSYHGPIEVNQSPSKLYNCFIQRVESNRQAWFYFLHLRGLLDKGYVSFLLKQLSSYSTATGVDLFDYIHEHYHLGDVPGFQQAYSELRDQVPYRNFPEIEDLTPYIQDSKYSLVLETYANNEATDCWFIGEKAIRAICFPSTPLLFMQQRAVEKLQSIGFQIDNHNDIDNIIWHQRQQKLLDIIEQDKVEFNAATLYNRSMHNRDVCLKWQRRYQNDNYFDEFLTQVLEH